MTATLTSPALSFIFPPPGLAPLTDFVLNEIDGAVGLFSLQASALPTTRLLVLDAAVFLPNYTPSISSEQSTALELTSADDALVLVVVNPGGDSTTVNLMAPIVVNSSTGFCAQLILDDQDWPLRAELGAIAN